MGMTIKDNYTRENSERVFHKISWQDYSRKTFDSALNCQKPIFLVISAPSWCHWCHVYESEDFLFNKNVYRYVNKNFIPIFVDSDKRPDVLKKLEGGWPSTIILAPNGARLFGFSGPSAPEILCRLCEEAVNIVNSKYWGYNQINSANVSINSFELSSEKIEDIEKDFLSNVKMCFDKTYGGFVFGSEQKFSTGVVYDHLLDVYENSNDVNYLNMVKLTFDNQFTDIKEIKTKYRLFDPVEGGFHRYSTQVDWTVPHYEKMVYDNALLIRAYAHLALIINDDKVKHAIDLSVSFVLGKLSSPDGGFYNSQDADAESFFYGEEERTKFLQPFIDKTIKIEGTALMTCAFLYIYSIEKNLQYKEIALKNIDFVYAVIWGKNGAKYSCGETKKQSFLAGLSISNAYALLVFVEACEVLNEPKYFSIAEEIASFCINTLYDIKNSGFFERVSTEIELYPNGEENDFSKNYCENALFSYCFTRLYLLTLKKEYLDVALRTLSITLSLVASGLDETAYVMKTIALIKKNKLV